MNDTIHFDAHGLTNDDSVTYVPGASAAEVEGTDAEACAKLRTKLAEHAGPYLDETPSWFPRYGRCRCFSRL